MRLSRQEPNAVWRRRERQMRFPRFIGKSVRARRVALPLVGVAALAIAGCGSSSSSSSSSTGSSASSSSGSSVKVALILKTFSNPYFVAMEKQAKEDAAKLGVSLDVSAGTTHRDTATHITTLHHPHPPAPPANTLTPHPNPLNP